MQQALFEINEANELVIGKSKIFDKDLNFKFAIPYGYTPSDGFPDLTPEQWRRKIEVDRRNGLLSSELANKILRSLDRLPDLQQGQKVGISFSGKDSQGIAMLARMKYPKHCIFAMFCDTGDEWDETYEFIPVFMKWIGLSCVTLETIGIHTLLEEQIPCWPMMRRRHCTKNLKMLPQRDYLDMQGYDQVRLDRKPASYRPSHAAKGAPVIIRHPAPLLVSGERHSEGDGRADLPVEPTRDPILMRVTARPVVEFTIFDIWEFIFYMRSPYNPIYHIVKRVACSGCPFASIDEMYTLGEYRPQKLERWVQTEKIINHPRPGRMSLQEIHLDMVKKNRLGLRDGQKIAT